MRENTLYSLFKRENKTTRNSTLLVTFEHWLVENKPSSMASAEEVNE